MLKNLTIILLIISVHYNTFSQGCLPNGIVFTTQYDIDNFQTVYPDCTEIEGNVTIEGPNITSLIGLNNLTNLKGDVEIINCSILKNLAGLNNLVSIGGSLSIWNNDSLESISELNNISVINENIYIGNHIYEAGNYSLKNLEGLNNLSTVHNNFEIYLNNKLSSIAELQKLTHIGGNFIIAENDSLQNLNGLNSLITVGNDFIIYFNNSIENLDPLSQLTSVSGYFSITSNMRLQSITGITNVNAESISILLIQSNPLLTQCDIKSVCEYLELNNDQMAAIGNGEGCRDVSQIIESCNASGLSEFPDQDFFTIYPNPTNDYFSIKNRNKIQIDRMRIINLCGQVIYEKPYNSNRIEISNYPKGIYLIELVSKRIVYKNKIIIN